MKTHYKHLTVALALVLIQALFFAAYAGSGSRDTSNNLALHVYFDYLETQPNLQNKWVPYFNGAAAAYYDALEANSRFKKVYLFNHVPEGKVRADIVAIHTNWNACSSGRFGTRNGLVTITDQMNPNKGFDLRTLTHELGHNIFGLSDCYGGVVDGAPVEWLEPNARLDPVQRFNYRTYMWSDEWIRHRATVSTMDGIAVFYNLGGRADGARSMMDRDGEEFATAATHIGTHIVQMKLPAYQYLVAGRSTARPVDAAARDYTVRSMQEAEHHSSEWAMVASTLGITAPTTLVHNALPASQYPEIVIIDGTGIVICLDRTGSMSDLDKLPLAKVGAQATVNLLRQRGTDNTPGHLAGVTSFNESGYVNAPIREIVNGSDRAVLNTAIASLTAVGGTSIGSGLRTSLQTLLNQPNPDQKIKIIILLSDGQQNSGEEPATVIPDLQANDVTVYTVALGGGADQGLLGDIASNTGGEMFVASSPVDIARYFMTIFANASGNGTLSGISVALAPSETHSEPASIEQGSGRVVFSALLDNPQIQFTLRRPNGAVVDPGTTDPMISYRTAGPQRLYDVATPAVGSWQMVVARPGTGSSSGGPFARIENPPLAINDNSTITSPLVVTDLGTIVGLNVAINLQHDYIGDLVVTLTSPQGKVVTLYNRSGGNTANIIGTYGVDLTSAESLTLFDGDAMTGTWTLTVSDRSGGDTGALNSWALSYGGASGSGLVTLTAMNENPHILVQGGLGTRTVNYPEPMVLRVSVHSGGPVAGASVSAQVTMPNGGSTAMVLLDNGDTANGDEMANDGIYSGKFRNYVGNGVYEFNVTASNQTGYLGGRPDGGGESQAVPPFVRSFIVQGVVSNVPAATEQWLSIKSFQSTVTPSRSNSDRLSLRGSFNLLPPLGFNPADQTATFGVGSFERSLPADHWRRVGRLQKYTQTTSNYSATIDYFVGGGSRCDFTYSATKATLGEVFANLSDVPIGLGLANSLGATFYDKVDVNVQASGRSFRLGWDSPEPVLFIDTFNITRNLTKTNMDSVVVSGRVLGSFQFNPAINGIELELGPFQVVIPPGAMTAPRSGTRLSYKTTPQGGTAITFTYDTEKGTFSLRAQKANFAGTANPFGLHLRLTGVSGALWNYRLNLQVASNGKSLRY